jgi:hypothetical protein
VVHLHERHKIVIVTVIVPYHIAVILRGHCGPEKDAGAQVALRRVRRKRGRAGGALTLEICMKFARCVQLHGSWSFGLAFHFITANRKH